MFNNDKKADHALDYDLKRAVYNGDYYRYFNANEFDAKVHPYEYVTTDLFRTAVSTIVDLVKVGEIDVDFGDDTLNEKVYQVIQKGNFAPRLEKLVENMKVYGSSYIEMVKTDDVYHVYNKQAKIVRAIYDETNPQADPTGFVVELEKEINKTKYTLVMTYTDGFIRYQAFVYYNTDKEREVDVKTHFPDMIPDEAMQKELSYVLDTGLDYNTLQGVQYNVPDGEFYGRGDLTHPILSKLNYYNRLVNLSDTIYTNNAFPKFQGSKEVGQLLNQAKQETEAEMSQEVDVPSSFAGVPAKMSNFVNSASYAFSRAMRKMRDKLVIFTTDGRGENKYIINEYNMDYIKTERNTVLDDLRDELFISKVLYSTDIATGQLSGVALKRLMQVTLNHVEDIQDMIAPVLQRIYYNIAQAEFNYQGDLPSINFEGIALQDVKQTIENLLMAEKVSNIELRKEAISYALDITPEQADDYINEQLQFNQPSIRDDQEESQAQ